MVLSKNNSSVASLAAVQFCSVSQKQHRPQRESKRAYGADVNAPLGSMTPLQMMMRMLPTVPIGSLNARFLRTLPYRAVSGSSDKIRYVILLEMQL
jgi:hypothetical protein